ncbi:hypothetical protein CEXT_452291 [Caerostris extrusa]|uniref:Uncharacterized protein n=1 Tax=Caerostris extrusa TaxID=172846 RepID=A0AAV4YCB1_CAEEX|nr:hypothetical protein CEXT_452291 [Caerostris extrusa]
MPHPNQVGKKFPDIRSQRSHLSVCCQIQASLPNNPAPSYRIRNASLYPDATNPMQKIPAIHNFGCSIMSYGCRLGCIDLSDWTWCMLRYYSVVFTKLPYATEQITTRILNGGFQCFKCSVKFVFRSHRERLKDVKFKGRN